MRLSASRRLTAASLVLFSVLVGRPAFSQALKVTTNSVPGEVLVNIASKSSKADVEAIARLGDVDDNQHVANVRNGAIWRMHSRGKSTEALMAALQRNPNVAYVEPNYVVQAYAEPNDPYYTEEYALKYMMGADKAWDVTTGSASIVVGVVDTGINYDHPDLAPNVWSNPGGKGNATCAAGTHGFNALNGTCDPKDTHYHGTHVSGTIGAVGNNGIGVTGVNWTTSIMGLKFLDSGGYGTVAGAIAAIDFAVQAKIDGVNVRVLSNSWGGFPFSKAMLDEINKAAENDILFVASAGNSAINNDVDAHYPSSYATANMIAVAATDSLDQLASFSNYGLTSVHLGAPGVSVLSTYYDGYGYLSGTSMAAPHVAGAAALLLSHSPSLTTAQVKAAILSNVEPVPALAGKTVSGGRLSLARMFGASEPADYSISISPASQTVVAGEPATFTVTVNGEPGFADQVWLYTSSLSSAGIATLGENPTSTSSTLTVWTTPGVGRTTPFTITAESSRRRHTASATLSTTTTPVGCLSFDTSTSVATGDDANGIALGDFNLDGKLDFAAADVQRDRVAVSAGGTTTSVMIPVGRSPIFVVSADVNRDGKTDLVTANSGSNDVSVLLGRGNGSFDAAVGYPAGTSPFAVATGDFNRDGRPDLVTANNASSSVSVLLGGGDGTFQAPASYATASGPYWVSVADLNRDGKADLVVANFNADSVSVLTGNGDGTFGLAKHYAVGHSPSSVAIGDWNGDGRADLAVASYGSNGASMLIGNGDGTFTATTPLSLAGGATSVAAGDLDGDGVTDLAFATNSGSVTTFRGQGGGTFTAGTFTNIGDVLNVVVIADVNGDGRNDFVTAGTGYVNGYGGVVRTRLNTGTCTTNCGVLGAPATHAAGAGANATVAADFNGDGKTDAAISSAGANVVSVFLGSGGGSMQPAASHAAGSAPRGLAVGDLNRDGVADLLVADSAANAVAFLAGNVNGTFASPLSQSVGASPEAVAVADFDGDGKSDAAVVNRGSNNVSILKGQGDGTFASRIDAVTGTTPVAVAAADFNLDGVIDLAVANAGSNNVSVLAGNGDGTFKAAVSWTAGSAPSAIAVGDLNRDGRPDLVVANSASNNISVLIGTAAGFATQVTYATGADPSGVVIVDLDRDGRLDLAVAARAPHDLETLAGNGDGTFAAPVARALGTAPSSLVAADFNGDGRPDLATANTTSNDMTIALDTCPSPDLVVSKSHSGTFTPGDAARIYTIVVTNPGDAATKGVVSVADALPRGLSAVAMGGAGWTCNLPTVSCTREDALAAGASYSAISLTVRVSSTAAGTVTNTVAVAGGGETNRANDTAADATQIAAVTDLVVSSVHSGEFTQGDQGKTYSIVVRNAGALATSGTITVTDTLPAGFSATSISGSGWSCTAATLTCQRNDSIAGASNAPAITVTFNVSATAPSGAVNVVSVSGGGQSDTSNDVARDATTVWRRDACGAVDGGVSYSVQNGGYRMASGDLDDDGNIDLVVGTNDSTPGVAVLLGRPDGTFGQANVFLSTSSPGAVRVADFDGDGNLDILMTRRTSAVQGIDVFRGNGDGSFTTPISTEFSSTAYYATSAIAVADFNGDAVPDIVLSEDAYGYSILLGRGDGSFNAPTQKRFDSGLTVLDTADTNRDGREDLIAVSGYSVFVLIGDGTGAFGVPVPYSVGTSVGTVTVCDLNGDGVADLALGVYGGIMVMTGNADGTFTTRPLATVPNGSVSYVRACDINGDGRQDLLASAYYGMYAFLGDGAGSLTLQGQLTSSGSDGTPIVGDFNHDGALDVARASGYEVRVSIGGCADVAITKSHYGSFKQGQTYAAYYTIRVKNLGPASSTAATVTEQLPAGMTATSMNGWDWACDVTKLRCTSTETVLPGYSYGDITVGVAVAIDAPGSVVNTATVSSPGDRNAANDIATDPTTILTASDLAISMTHSGSFGRGQNAVYTITVKNVGSVATTGTVYVANQPPAGLTPVSMSGVGWTCTISGCSRSDALAPGSSYPAITFTASVAANAPQTLTNVATVSSYNDGVTSNNSASDVTQILWEPTNVIATASSASAVTITWTGVANAIGYAIFRTERLTTPFAQISTAGPTTFTDTSVEPGKSYLYQVRATDGSILGGASPSDLATVVAFTDDPVVANTTTVKAVHLTELRAAVNAVRSLAGLTPVSFAEQIGGSVFIKAAHIQELRSAIDAARSALGLNAISYIDPSIGAGYLMKATHIQQLRTAVK